MNNKKVHKILSDNNILLEKINNGEINKGDILQQLNDNKGLIDEIDDKKRKLIKRIDEFEKELKGLYAEIELNKYDSRLNGRAMAVELMLQRDKDKL